MDNAVDIHPKVAGASLSASLSLIILWAISYWVDVPTEVAAAFTAVLAFAGGWLAPPITSEVVTTIPVTTTTLERTQ